MGHDIFAYKVDKKQEKKYEEALLGEFSSDNYTEYCNKVYAGQYRRSAFDPYNRVIYLALDADDLYAGCSGCGEERLFTIDQLRTAYEQLPYVVADKLPKIDTAVTDVLTEMLGETTEFTSLQQGPEDHLHANLNEEKQFLWNTITWMENNGVDTVRIFFG